jgi:Uma2 family endonuclease
MAAASTATAPTLLSIEQYRNTTYRPDVDYVDGHIEERNVGDTDHGKLQKRLLILLSLREEEWGVEALPETRVQVSPTRFRVPDVCVVREEDADNPIITGAPLLCLEVLSPGQTLSALRERAQDFFNMGVPEVWVFDPPTQTAYVCLPDSMTEQRDGVLRLEGTPIELSLAEVFKALNRKS